MPLWILGAIGWLTIVLVTNVVIYLLSRDPLGKLIIDSSTLSVQQKLLASQQEKIEKMTRYRSHETQELNSIHVFFIFFSFY